MTEAIEKAITEDYETDMITGAATLVKQWRAKETALLADLKRAIDGLTFKDQHIAQLELRLAEEQNRAANIENRLHEEIRRASDALAIVHNVRAQVIDVEVPLSPLRKKRNGSKSRSNLSSGDGVISEGGVSDEPGGSEALA